MKTNERVPIQSIKMEDNLHDLEQSDDLKPIPISNSEDDKADVEGIPAILGLIFSIFIGLLCGSRTQTTKETLIYFGMFTLESLICLVTSNIVPTIAFRQASKRLSFFILVQGLSCFLGFYSPIKSKL